jgi:predicted kinase
MSAIAGSGKDTYIKKYYPNWPVVSLDDIRVELKIKPTDKSGNGKVIQLAKERAKEHMRKHENFIWNATNITKQLRKQLIDLFISYGAMVNIVYIEVPYKTLHSQNMGRDTAIPADVVDRMVTKFEPPTYDEAQNIIYVP